MRGGIRQWTDERIGNELRRATAVLGNFPSSSELRDMGMNGLCCAATKAGGLMEWSRRLGLARTHSDSDTGWDGELAVMKLFADRGIDCERTEGVKYPWDLLAGGVLRIDVKSARFARYDGPRTHCSGWFFRIGKNPQADLIVLYKLDTGGMFAVPWWEVPSGNVTLTPSGGRYAPFADNWELVRGMIAAREAERAAVLTGQRVA